MPTDFKRWVESLANPKWPVLPLTHTTTARNAKSIIDSDTIETVACNVIGTDAIYTFYGRPAYRVGAEGTIPVEAFAPICFVLEPSLIDKASAVFPFDTGAYNRRMFKYHEGDNVNFKDFDFFGDDISPNKLIKKVFRTIESYYHGDRTSLANRDDICPPHELDVRIYLDIIAQAGSNHPDDRASTIEIINPDPLPLRENLIAIVAPHTLVGSLSSGGWIDTLSDHQVEVLSYEFYAGKSADYYHAQAEGVVRDFIFPRYLTDEHAQSCLF